MKKLLLLTLLLFSFGLASCDSSKVDPCADGHDWKEATLSAPKTCRECGETKGKPLTQDISMLQAAIDKLNEGNYTIDLSETVAEDPSMKGTTKIQSTKDKLLMTIDLGEMNMNVKMYGEINDENVTLWYYMSQETGWMNMGEISMEEFNDSMSQDPFKNLTSEMFTLKNGVWVGNVEMISEALNGVVADLAIKTTFEVSKYHIKLDDYGNIKTIDLIMTTTIDNNGDITSTTMTANYKYSKIGSTKVERPSDLK